MGICACMHTCALVCLCACMYGVLQADALYTVATNDFMAQVQGAYMMYDT